MSETVIFTPVVTIPEHLIGQIRSKLAYVDEAIAGASIREDGAEITRTLRETPGAEPPACVRARKGKRAGGTWRSRSLR